MPTTSHNTHTRTQGRARTLLACLAALIGLASAGAPATGMAQLRSVSTTKTAPVSTTVDPKVSVKEAEAIRRAYEEAKRGEADVTPPKQFLQPAQTGPRRVLVELDTRALDRQLEKLREQAARGDSKAYLAAKRDALAGMVDALRPGLKEAGVELVRAYDNLPLVVAFVDKDDKLDKLGALKGVATVHENMWFYPLLAETLPIIGQPNAAQAGAVGAGTSVAVLDTGADFTVPALGSCVAAGAPGCRVVDAKEFSLLPDFAMDDDGHGTNVSSIVAGVAPGAGILALDVFANIAGESLTDVVGLAAAVDYVIQTKNKFNTVAMNLSLGTYGMGSRGRCISPMDALFASAVAAGVTPIVAAGNDGNPSRLAIPACSPFAVSVGATDNRDDVTGFSNSSASLDLLAPGDDVTAGGLTMSGTSMAAPHVAGAWAVMRAARPDLSADQVLQALKDTGAPVVDTRNGLTFPRLQLDGALSWNGSAPIAIIGNLTEVVFAYDWDWAECQVQEIADGAACGYEVVEQTVTDAAQCGYDTVTSAAQCGVEMVACGIQVISSGVECLLDQLAGRACEETLYCEEPQSCQVPATCDVIGPCNPSTMSCEPLTCSIEVCEG